MVVVAVTGRLVDVDTETVDDLDEGALEMREELLRSELLAGQGKSMCFTRREEELPTHELLIRVIVAERGEIRSQRGVLVERALRVACQADAVLAELVQIGELERRSLRVGVNLGDIVVDIDRLERRARGELLHGESRLVAALARLVLALGDYEVGDTLRKRTEVGHQTLGAGRPSSHDDHLRSATAQQLHQVCPLLLRGREEVGDLDVLAEVSLGVDEHAHDVVPLGIAVPV